MWFYFIFTFKLIPKNFKARTEKLEKEKEKLGSVWASISNALDFEMHKSKLSYSGKNCYTNFVSILYNNFS